MHTLPIHFKFPTHYSSAASDPAEVTTVVRIGSRRAAPQLNDCIARRMPTRWASMPSTTGNTLVIRSHTPLTISVAPWAVPPLDLLPSWAPIKFILNKVDFDFGQQLRVKCTISLSTCPSVSLQSINFESAFFWFKTLLSGT